MSRPVLITVAPNGARKLKQDHPALPISPLELGATAASSLDAGAAMLHLHVRDKALQHSNRAAAMKTLTAASLASTRGLCSASLDGRLGKGWVCSQRVP